MAQSKNTIHRLMSAILGISPPTLSFHLGELAAAGLVQSRRDGRSIIYAADYAAMNGLIAYLTENCCRGDLAVWDGHVAMIVGHGTIIEAGDPVQLSPIRTTNVGQGFQGFWRPTA